MAGAIDPKKPNDVDLVKNSVENPEEFVHIMHRYEKPLARYLRHLINASTDDIEDLLQNVFIKVYSNLNDFDVGLSFSSWIYRIAHNEAIDHVRKLKRRPVAARPSLDSEDDENEFEKIADDFDIATESDKHFLKQNVAKVLDLLDPKYRSVLVLKFLEDKDYNEISDILKKPIGTVGTLINRAKKQFRQKAESLGLRIEHL